MICSRTSLHASHKRASFLLANQVLELCHVFLLFVGKHSLPGTLASRSFQSSCILDVSPGYLRSSLSFVPGHKPQRAQSST